MNKAMLKNGLKIALVAGGIMAIVPSVYGQGIGLQTLERMLVPTPQTLERGEQVFEDQCATCHGDEGRGGAELGERFGAQGFVDVEVERSGLKSIFSVVSSGIEDAEHPVFDNLFFQDQWAVAHYVHGLIDDPQPDPQEIIDQVREQAQFGVCDPDIRDGIAQFLEPEDEAQIEAGRQEYTTQCASCHGDQGLGDGPAGAAVNPRNFQDDPEEWVNGTSPLALFNTLQQGIEGTAMPAYGHLPDDTNWALVHFVRQELIPEENLQEVTEAQIEEACRALSAPPRPPSIPVERAMEFLAEDTGQQRYIHLQQLGDPIVDAQADPVRGQEVYQQSCASCHGADGSMTEALGPYGAFPPYLFVEMNDLVPASMGGTYRDVARRTLAGPHATIPNMPSVTGLGEQDWKDIQAYIAQFDGEGRDRVRILDTDAQPEEELEGDELEGEESPDSEEEPTEEEQTEVQTEEQEAQEEEEAVDEETPSPADETANEE